MESEENRTKALSRGTLEPLDQIELDNQSEETQENVNEAFGGIMNRVCNKFVSALKSPEKMIEVIRNKNSKTKKMKGEDSGRDVYLLQNCWSSIQQNKHYDIGKSRCF